MTSNSAPVLAISIENPPWFDDMFTPLVTSIRAKAEFLQTEDAATALQLLTRQPAPRAVLLTDQALASTENAAVWDAVLEFVRGGGTAVVMGFFSAFVPPDDMEPFFARAGLGWASGAYCSKTFTVSEAAAAAAELDVGKLPPKYSQKALFVKNVAPLDMLYVTDEEEVVESTVSAPTSAHASGATAVALAKVGSGRLGYIGDVNAEDESHTVVLAMCGLL